METIPTNESLSAEYEHAQLAMRALDRQISNLISERYAWQSRCHHIINQSFEQGVIL